MQLKEQFIFRLVELMFKKQQTFLLLDELYEDEIVGLSIRNIQIDSPFQQLLFEGVLSQHIIDDSVSISFTVEAYFQHLLAKVLENSSQYVTPYSLLQLLKENKLKGLPEAVSNLLCFDIEKGNFIRLADFIDLNEEDNETLDLCVMPLLSSLMINGVKETLTKLLENPTENDWIALLNLDNRLDYLQLHVLRKEFLTEVMIHNQLNTKKTVWLGLKAIALLDKIDAMFYLNKIDTSAAFFEEDADLLFSVGDCEYKFGNYDKALEYFEKCLGIELKAKGNKHPSIGLIFSNFGMVWSDKGNYEKSIKYYQKALRIVLKIYGKDHPSLGEYYNDLGVVYRRKKDNNKAILYYDKALQIFTKIYGYHHPYTAIIYNNLSLPYRIKGEYRKAIAYCEKALNVFLKVFGNQHPMTGNAYNNLGRAFGDEGNYNKAIQSCEKALAIRLKIYGDNHSHIGISYNTFGDVYMNKGEFDKAIEYYEKSLVINLKVHGDKHPDAATSYNNLGNAWKSKENYKKAVILYKKAFKIQKGGGVAIQIAQCYEKLNDKKNALAYYIQSAEIRKEEIGVKDKTTEKSITNSIRLVKELNKENELPDWIKDSKL